MSVYGVGFKFWNGPKSKTSGESDKCFSTQEGLFAYLFICSLP